MNELDDLIARLRPVLVRYPQIAAAWVFGSAARGELRPDSDIDIGILLRDPRATAADEYMLLGELTARLEVITAPRAVDVVLLEQGSLTSGTTWHAAGLVSQLKSTHSLTKLAAYSAVRVGKWKLYLEPRNGIARLHDLELDPAERIDMASAEPQIFQALKARYDTWEKSLPPRAWTNISPVFKK